jgi:excisionase family DNA binding protein
MRVVKETCPSVSIRTDHREAPNLRKAIAGLCPRPAAAVNPGMSASSVPRLGLTTSEAARHLGVSLSTIRRWSDAGHLVGYRTPGGQRRFSVEQLEKFLDSLQPRTG